MDQLPPKTAVAGFTVLGRIPWGGKTPPSEAQRIHILPEQQGEVLAACEKLAKTGRTVCARLEKDSSVAAHRHIGLIDLLALEAGIRWYRDNTPGLRPSGESWKEYRQRQPISPTDVLHYICRSIVWLLREMGATDLPSRFPTDHDALTAAMDQVAEAVRVQSGRAPAQVTTK